MKIIKNTPLMVALAAVLLVALVPIAGAVGERLPIKAGERNPSNNQQEEYTRETEIIARTDTYGTRQSNKSDNGGGAIYGCRSAAGGSEENQEPCIRSNNLSTGRAFEFESDGLLGGTIQVGAGGREARPFTTNATGKATGLNADQVDGQSASTVARAARFVVQVSDAGVAANGRGVSEASRQAAGDYQVVFDRDIGACALTATLVGITGGEVSVLPEVAQDRASTSVDVRTFDSAGTPADRAFHLTAQC